MATVKEMRVRIGSVKSTQKITKALQMVAAAKLRRAYGRELSAASWARRSLAAATICIAFVIFCVDFTLAIRLRISLRLAMPSLRRRVA